MNIFTDFIDSQEKPYFFEGKLLTLITKEELNEAGISKEELPKMYRGLPRLYDRENPAKAYIKKPFCNFSSLKRHWIDKTLFLLYANLKVSSLLPVSLFTWVMNDGLGDFYAQKELATLLQESFPHIPFHLITIVHKTTLSVIDKATWQKLANSSMILQFPTYFPDTPRILQKLQGIKYEHLAEYGFIEAGWCNPLTPYRSLGLHFLEKGLLFSELSLQALPEPLAPRFNLAYFATKEGAYIYLHALLKMLENDSRDIDLFLPNISPLLEAMESWIQQGDTFPLFERFGIQSVHIYFEDTLCNLSIQPKGKKLQLIQKKDLSKSAFQTLLFHSTDLVACRGDRSFSEVVVSDQLFFYDPPQHSKNFLKDLVAIGENRLQKYPSAIEYLKLFLYGIKVEEKDTIYVEEEYFYPKILTREERGDKMGELLQNPKTKEGIRQLHRILRLEHSANEFIKNLVTRSLFHLEYPDIEALEKGQVEAFLLGKKTFSSVILKMKKAIVSKHGTR